ncbi:MAG: indolepyruvate oxidoreductase subunit beta [Thermacetogeniaceae bacterium]
MSENTSIIITGVGGQGILLASRVLSSAALKAGHQVKISETHGMAQRGGSVITHLRYGSTIYSPLISVGQADYVLGFEKLEAVRCIPYLNKNGLLIINDQEIPPLPVLLGQITYPEITADSFRSSAPRLLLLKASAKAQQLGNSRVVNMILLGCLAQYLDISREHWQSAIEECVQPKYLELNEQAFTAGMQIQ